MKQIKLSTLLWSVAGLLFALLVFSVISDGLAGEILVTESEGIRKTSDAVISSIRQGDWHALETLVAGHPILVPKTGDSGSPEEAIWKAYQSSLEWTYPEPFAVRGALVTQTVTVTCLDIRGVTDRITGTLSEVSGVAADPDIRDTVLMDATKQILETEPPVMKRDITLTFLRENGQWSLVPDNALQALMSGFTVS